MSRMLAGFIILLFIPSPTAAQVEGGVVGGFTQVGPLGPTRDNTPPATGRSTIRGRIVAADSGQPIRRATVRISAPELRGQRTTLTDADGRYEFAKLPAGRYTDQRDQECLRDLVIRTDPARITGKTDGAR